MSEKDRLPHGWVVKTSINHPDRVYYFNMYTGNSTWDCPTLVPKRLSGGFKEPASKKNLSRSSDSEHEGVRRFSAITPEDSPRNCKTPTAYRVNPTSLKRIFNVDTPKNSPHHPKTPTSCNLNLKSQKRPQYSKPPDTKRKSFEKPSPKQVSVRLGPPTAIVTPVVPGQGKNNSSAAVCAPSQSKKEKKKIKNKLKRAMKKKMSILHAEGNKSTDNLRNIQEEINHLNKAAQSKVFVGQDKPSTSTAIPNISFERKHIESPITSGPRKFVPIGFPSEKINTEDVQEDNFFEDVEMIDVSANLTTVDEVVATAKESNQPLSYWIVIDTNILVHELNHIDQLKDTPLQGCGPPHILIPWVVVKELDGLKSSTTKNTGKLAASAVRYLHKNFKSKHPRFHGQSAKDAEECKQSYHDNNDDRIIDCCHSLRGRMPPEKVILMTNDKNLANKAMIYRIIVHDWDSLLKDLKPDISIKANPAEVKKIKKKKKEEPTSHISQINLEKKLLDERDGWRKEIDNVMNKATNKLKEVLDTILVEEMTRVYGDQWWEYNIDRRLLQEILAAFIKFWSAVFSFYFVSSAVTNFEILHGKLTSAGGISNTLEDCIDVLAATKNIFSAIRSQSPNILILINEIQIIGISCRHLFTKFHHVDSSLLVIESSVKEVEEESALAVFNHNWTVLNEMCGMVMDFCGVQHNFVYNKPEAIPPESEYRRVVADLYPCLLQLKQLMKKMLIQIQNSTPNKKLFINLYTALKDLIPNLNIKFTMPDMVNFTPRGLERFCCNPANRQKVEFGCKQLENFCDKLKEAIQVLMYSRNRNVTNTAQPLNSTTLHIGGS